MKHDKEFKAFVTTFENCDQIDDVTMEVYGDREIHDDEICRCNSVIGSPAVVSDCCGVRCLTCGKVRGR